MSEKEIVMSIASLKHITNEELDGQGDNKQKRSSTTISSNALNSYQEQLPTISQTPFQTSSSNFNLNSDRKIVMSNPILTSSSLNKFQLNDQGYLSASNPEFPIDQNSVGANFLRQMFSSNQPKKNYMAYLKKDKVDLTDECDSMIVMQILQKQNKNKNECDFLTKSIKGMHLFQKNKDMLTMKDCNKQLLEQFKLEYFPARKTIFNYGDYGYTYYIVLSGGADLLIPSPIQENDKQKEPQSTKNSNNQEKGESTPSGSQIGTKMGKKKLRFDSKWNVLKKTFNPDQEHMPFAELQSPIIDDENSSFYEDENYDDFLRRVYPGMNYIKTFKPGEAFGEIALMTKQRRTGTLICREGTYLMTLTKECFDVILGAYNQNLIQRKINFLKTYNFFRSMPDSKLLSLLHFMKIVNYRNKNIVYTESDPSRFIYLIREGEVELSQICNIEGDNEKEKKKKEEENDNPNDINAIKAQKDMRNKNKRIPIVIKGKNSYFGEDEILKHLDRRKQQAICSSESAEIFLLKKDILYNYTRGYSVIEKLKEEFKVKGEWHQIRKANIVQTKQSARMDLEKQINQLNSKSYKELTFSNLSEQKNIENKQMMSSNIFSQKQNNGVMNTSGQNSLSIITSSANKRQSLMNSSTQNNNTNNNIRSSFQIGVSPFEPIDVMTSKQRLSLRTNPFNSNSLNTLQKQLEFTQNTKIGLLNQASSEDSENFFSTGIGKSTVNRYIPDKLTPETKVHLKLQTGRNSNYYFQATSAGLIGQENQNLVQEHKQPLTIAEEEDYIENKILNNQKRKYNSVNQKSQEQLAQVALEQFGDTSHNAFVNKVGQTIEYKMQILKKLNSNGLSSPTNVFLDLYEEFGLRKKNNNFKIRKSNDGLSSQPLTPKEANNKNLSAPNGHEFQKRILLERKQQIKENIKKINAQTYIEDLNYFCEQMNEYLPQRNSRTFHQQFSYALTDINQENTEKYKNRVCTHGVVNKCSQCISSLQQYKKQQDKPNNFDEISISSYESSSSQSSIHVPKINSFSDKTFKQPSFTLIKNLDVLEEVSENNSPIKSNIELKQFKHHNIEDLKNTCHQEYGITQQTLQQKLLNGNGSRIVFERIDPNRFQQCEMKTSQIQFQAKYEQQRENNQQLTRSQSTYYQNKSFKNRSTPSLKQKQEARRVISRNSLSQKENQFKITSKHNNFFQQQKNLLIQGKMQNLNSIHYN